METPFQGAKIWSSELGEFVDQKHIILAGMLKDYNPRLSLAYLPASKQDSFGTMKPFQIQERRDDGRVVAIRDLTYKDMENPGAILAWCAKGDLVRRGANAVFAELELERLANEAFRERQLEEERADRREMIEAIAKGGRDRKHYFRHDGHTFRR